MRQQHEVNRRQVGNLQARALDALEQEQPVGEVGVDQEVQVIELDEEPDLPDSVFVEDTAFILPECAVITRPARDFPISARAAASKQAPTLSTRASSRPASPMWIRSAISSD